MKFSEIMIFRVFHAYPFIRYLNKNEWMDEWKQGIGINFIDFTVGKLNSAKKWLSTLKSVTSKFIMCYLQLQYEH